MIDPVIRLLLIDSGQIEPNETFYPIKDQPKYLVSPFGNIFSIRRQKLLKPWNNGPYKYVTLLNSPTEKKVSCSVHGLVAKHFIPNLDNKPHVHHIDSNPWNNHFSNLIWVSVHEHHELTREAIRKRGEFRNHKRYKKP